MNKHPDDQLADSLRERWDANESENNPLHSGKLLRIKYGELERICRALERNAKAL